MDFDEYDYLEKTVENPESEKLKDKIDGNGEIVKSEGGEGRRSLKHKSDENVNDINNRSKRVKSRDERGERDRERGGRDRERGDRDKEKGSSHHRSSQRDVERSDRSRRKSNPEHKDREKENGREDSNGKDRDIEKEKDHDREKRARDRENGKEKDHDREKRARDRENDKEKDWESGRERSHRSRSRSERQKDELDREKHQDKERSRDRELREREKEKEPKEPELDNRRHKEKREEQDVDPERDQRTVFAYQICLKADERDVYEFFSRAGKVRDVRLIMDRNSRRSKGFGYIEFYDAMSVPMAIALSGQTLLSSQVMVKPSEAEKNLVQSTASASGGPGGLTGPYSGGARRLYVGNLHFNIREDQLRQVFEAFGSVELVQLPLDQETGHCKGYGFVQFARLEDARAAESLNGQLEIAGRAIKVSAITDQAGMQDIGVNPGDFDDDEGGGLTLNAHSRASLMQKLDRSGTNPSITSILGNPALNGLGSQPTVPVLGTVPTFSPFAGFPALDLPVPTITVPSVDIVGVPSECLLLKNMFDPNIESEPDFDLDIKEDVQEECSKYGTLKHIFVDKNTQGFVYLRFDNTQAAAGAQRALHGRWFAQKMITATFMVPETYESKFTDSK